MASLGSEAEAESLLAQILMASLMGLPPPGRIVLVNPMTGDMILLQAGGDAITTEGGSPPPASKMSMEAMRKLHPCDLDPDQECPVCLVDIAERGSEETAVREMPCKHKFHERCIMQWLGMHGSCPVCRFQMPIEEAAPRMAGEDRTTMMIFVTVVEPQPAGADDGEQEGEESMENTD